MLSGRRIAVITLSVSIAALAWTACGNKKKGRSANCAPAVGRVQQRLGALCKAWRSALRPEKGRDLAQLKQTQAKLAQAVLPPIRALPVGPLAILGPGRLVLGMRVVGRWSTFWRQPTPAKSAQPKTGKPDAPKGPPPGLGNEKTTKGTTPKIKLPPKGKGMLGVLSRLDNKKLGTMFSKGAAVPRGALGGTVIEEITGEELVKDLRKLRGDKPKPELLLAIWANTPARQVIAFLDLVRRAGYQRVSFLLTPETAPRDPVPQMAGPGRNTPASGPSKPWAAPTRSRVAKVAKPWSEKGCGEVKKLLDGLRKSGGVTDCGALATAVQQAISKCGCPVDEGPLLGLVHRFFPPLVFVAIHRVTLAAKAKPVKVSDGDQPWSKLLGRVLKMNAAAFRLTGFELKDPEGLGLEPNLGQGPQVRPGRLSATGGLDAHTIRRVVRRHLVEIKYCYMSVGLPANPKLTGTVTVTFTVNASGSVARVSVSASTLKHDGTEGCIKRSVLRWRFPKPTDTMPFVSYTFHFAPAP